MLATLYASLFGKKAMEIINSFAGAVKDCVSPFLSLQTSLSLIAQKMGTTQLKNDFLRVMVIFLVAVEEEF